MQSMRQLLADAVLAAGPHVSHWRDRLRLLIGEPRGADQAPAQARATWRAHRPHKSRREQLEDAVFWAALAMLAISAVAIAVSVTAVR